MMAKKNLLTMSELANELGIDRRQVYAWDQRKDRNGFPAPAGYDMRPYRKEPVRVWNLSAVKKWLKNYDPTAWPNRPRKNLR